MTIDQYLGELERRLPRTRRGRFLAEAEEHLRDAATAERQRGLGAEAAEQAAVESFGDVAVVARRLAAEAAVWETRIAAVLALGATASFVFPLYVVPENTLPPATWEVKPREILVLQLVSVALWIAAGALALVATVLAWTRWSKLAAPALLSALVVLAGSVVADIALVVRWFAWTPATPNWALAAPLAFGCLVACAGAALRARSSRRQLSPQD